MTRSEERGGPADELPSFSGANSQHEDAPTTADFDGAPRYTDDHVEEGQDPPDHEPLTPDHLDHAPTQRAPQARPRARRVGQAMLAAGALCFAAVMVGLATPDLLGADALTTDAYLLAACTGALLIAMSRVLRHQD